MINECGWNPITEEMRKSTRGFYHDDLPRLGTVVWITQKNWLEDVRLAFLFPIFDRNGKESGYGWYADGDSHFIANLNDNEVMAWHYKITPRPYKGDIE